MKAKAMPTALRGGTKDRLLAATTAFAAVVGPQATGAVYSFTSDAEVQTFQATTVAPEELLEVGINPPLNGFALGGTGLVPSTDTSGNQILSVLADFPADLTDTLTPTVCVWVEIKGRVNATPTVGFFDGTITGSQTGSEFGMASSFFSLTNTGLTGIGGGEVWIGEISGFNPGTDQILDFRANIVTAGNTASYVMNGVGMAVVPEPSAAILALLGALPLLRRRR